MVVPPPAGPLQLLDRDEAAKVLPDVFDRQRLGRPGEVSRDHGFWEQYFADPPGRDRHPGSALFFAVGDAGYVAYRAVQTPGNVERERIVVEEMRATSPEAEAALWSYLVGIDLVGHLTVRRRPVDEPVRWRLADPRRLRVTEVEDRLHLRILDLPAAMSARRWGAEGRIILEVAPAPVAAGAIVPVPGGGPDPVPGRWVIDAGPDGAECRPAGRGEAADLALDVTALGSLYLGGYPASLLAAGGRVTEMTAGALAAADRLFATWPAPLTGTGF